MEHKERLVRAAMAGRWQDLDSLLPGLEGAIGQDLALACALCRLEPALALIAAAENVNQALPPLDWPPLLYLCFSRLQRRAKAAEAACAIAQALLARDANPNAYKPDGSGSHPQTALYGAAGVNANAVLTRLLLAAGADPNDGTEEIGAETIYHAAELPDNACLSIVLETGVTKDKLSYCLARKLDFEDPQGTALFLKHGADPNFVTPFGAYETRVHKAVRSDRSLFVLDQLLAAGGGIGERDANGHTPYALAVRLGRTFLAGRLLHAGARAEELGKADRFLGACARGDRANARRFAAAQPDVVARAAEEDGGHLADMAFEGRQAAVSTLLDLGFPADARGEIGSALHMACWRGHAETARSLVAAGASLELANDFGGTPLDTTMYGAFNCHSPEGGMTSWGLPEDVRHGDYPGTLRVLLEAGADASVTSGYPTGRADIDAVIDEFHS